LVKQLRFRKDPAAYLAALEVILNQQRSIFDTYGAFPSGERKKRAPVYPLDLDEQEQAKDEQAGSRATTILLM